MVQCPELGSPTSEVRPDTRPENQDPVSHTAFGKFFLPAFNRCCVGVVAYVDVFLMYLW